MRAVASNEVENLFRNYKTCGSGGLGESKGVVRQLKLNKCATLLNKNSLLY
jgi:hypothetical protein